MTTGSGKQSACGTEMRRIEACSFTPTIRRWYAYGWAGSSERARCLIQHRRAIVSLTSRSSGFDEDLSSHTFNHAAEVHAIRTVNSEHHGEDGKRESPT
jgi:hypothetical protein